MSGTNSNNSLNQFGDTTLTKVFVGGLAWETPKEALKDHFESFGEILEAVIISDKITGRSKGYGFVTFKEPEAAKKACEEATPFINGRRANCNLASLGARRSRSSSASAAVSPIPAPQQGSNIVWPRSASPAPANQVQWYYPLRANASPYHQHHHQAPVPFYGYNPTYIATDLSYNQKLGYTAGAYMNGHYSQVYPGQAVVGANSSLVPVYHPAYYNHYHQQAMGVPAHYYGSPTAGPLGSVPALISKPMTMGPNTGGNGEAFRMVVKI